MSDGGPQFTSSHLAEFLNTWGVSYITSSPHYPQSNGNVEVTVKSMNKFISASWTGRSVNWNILPHSLLQYQNTPCRKDGQSPAQKLFGHPVQDTLPAHCRSFAPEWQKSVQDAETAAAETQVKSQQSYNQHAHELSTLQVGNHIAIQNPTSKMWDIYGVITAIGPFWRYFVKTQSGRVLVRNHRFLCKHTPYQWLHQLVTYLLTFQYQAMFSNQEGWLERRQPQTAFQRPHMVIQLLWLTAKGAWWGGVRILLTLLRNHVSVTGPRV